MIILIQNGLDDIEEYLKKRGYNVIKSNNTTNFHDIYIYSSSAYIGLYNEILSNNNINNNIMTKKVLMINANNKYYSEIEEIINSKKYSNLFESEGLF